MNLPEPGPRYDPAVERERNTSLEQADRENHKRNRDVTIVGGARLILASPNGSLWSITVSNAGVVGATAL